MIRDIPDKYELWLQQHSESAFFGTPCIVLAFSEDDYLDEAIPTRGNCRRPACHKIGVPEKPKNHLGKRESTEPSS